MQASYCVIFKAKKIINCDPNRVADQGPDPVRSVCFVPDQDPKFLKKVGSKFQQNFRSGNLKIEHNICLVKHNIYMKNYLTTNWGGINSALPKKMDMYIFFKSKFVI